jgi:hypothetical protein
MKKKTKYRGGYSLLECQLYTEMQGYPHLDRPWLLLKADMKNPPYNALFDLPYNQLPLYTHNPDPHAEQIIVWRLKIGR